MDIDAKQYARIEIGGLFVMFERAGIFEDPDLDELKGSR
jgi:hypothetical protein